jgi:riboflavin kinase/FMN adenylyltransferase
MEVLLGIDQIKKPFVNPVVTLGNFDGVHLGHQRIFERLKNEAAKIRGEPLVVTFEPHPLKILSPRQCPPLITPFRKKMLLIEEMGIDKVICIEFSLAFAEISPLEFVRDFLAEKINTKKVIIGYNYHFGKGKSGDAETLKKICKRFNIEVHVMEALIVDHIIVSSSKIRELIQEGNVEKASKLLGRNYPIIGKVIEGARRGNTLGFPTANLEISEELYPKTGVYAVEVLWKSQVFKGLANVGYNPTFHSKTFSVEVHILSFNQEIYGDEIQVNFKRRIRDEIRFDSPSHLIDQIRKDIRWAEENVF